MSAAYKALEKLVGVSRVALYGKLNGLEPGISRAIVDYSGKELAPLVKEVQGTFRGMMTALPAPLWQP